MPALPTDCVYIMTQHLKSDKCGCIRWDAAFCSTATGDRAACMKLKAEAARNSNKRYKEFNGKCYLFYPNSGLHWSVNGETARPYCQGFGADMVAVESSAENEFIKRVVDVEESDMPNSADFWVLGAKRTGVGNPFHWMRTGSTIGAGFSDWGPDVGYKGASNVFVYMRPRGGWSGNDKRKWSAFSCCEYNIICEA